MMDWPEYDRLSNEYDAALRNPALSHDEVMTVVRRFRAEQVRTAPMRHAELRAELVEKLKRKLERGTQCVKEAAFRYTWPGGEESFLCAEHAPDLEGLATAIGLPLQIIALDRTVERDHETRCQQVSDRGDTA